MLLVKDEPALLDAVLDVVDTYGRRGKVYRDSASEGQNVLRGVPDGWVLVDDVQIYSLPQDVKRLDLHVLVPLTTAQLHLSGGLKLPGRIRKWSTLSPPQIRAAVAEAESITITLVSLDREAERHEWSEPATAMVVPLESLGLVDGDYEVELAVGGEAISRLGLRLRSADSPDVVTWETCTRLNYELGQNPLAVLTAVPATDESEVIVDGLNTLGRWPHDVAAAPAATHATWSTTKRSSGVERPTVVLGTPDAKSCMVTGAHRIMLPTWHGGRTSRGTIEGVCQTCGLRKTHPARPRWKGQGEVTVVAAHEHRFAELAGQQDLDVGWDVCLDALVHVGGGLSRWRSSAWRPRPRGPVSLPTASSGLSSPLATSTSGATGRFFPSSGRPTRRTSPKRLREDSCWPECGPKRLVPSSEPPLPTAGASSTPSARKNAS